MTFRDFHDQPRFRRLSRTRPEPPGTLFIPSSSTASRTSVQDVRAGLRKQLIRVTNRPARLPKHGHWPFELRADMVAALLDFETTRQLCKAIAVGAAPRPGAVRGTGASREVVWSLEAVRTFVAMRHSVQNQSE